MDTYIYNDYFWNNCFNLDSYQVTVQRLTKEIFDPHSHMATLHFIAIGPSCQESPWNSSKGFSLAECGLWNSSRLFFSRILNSSGVHPQYEILQQFPCGLWSKGYRWINPMKILHELTLSPPRGSPKSPGVRQSKITKGTVLAGLGEERVNINPQNYLRGSHLFKIYEIVVHSLKHLSSMKGVWGNNILQGGIWIRIV